MAGIPIRPELLKQARLAARASQEEFAERLGITRVWLSQLELGKRSPGIETLDSLAKVLGEQALERAGGRKADPAKLAQELGVEAVAHMIVDDTDRTTFRRQLLAETEEPE